MSSPRPTDRASRLAYSALALTFLAMAVFAIDRTMRLESRVTDEQRQRAQAELQRELAVWEADELNRLRDAVQNLAVDPVRWAAHPTAPVEAAYVWSPQDASEAEPGLLFPPSSPLEHIPTLLQDPCMVTAASVATATASRAQVEAAWLQCADRPLPVAMLAASRAAGQALADSRPADALDDLQAVDVPIFPRADQTAALGLSEDRLVFRQLQLAQAAQQSGDERRAVTVLARVGDEILGQRGSTLERTLGLLDFPIISDLRALDAIPTADRLAIRAEPARRHLAGYRTAVRIAQAGPRAFAGRELLTVTLQTTTTAKPPPDVQVKIINDSLGDRRYMLAIVPLPGGLTVALQLDPDDLLSDLLASDTARPLRVLDANGTVMAPRGMPAAPLWAQVPFGQLFPELRLAMLTTAADGPTPAWRMSQLAPIGLVAIMAIIAMAARLRADRQLHELWDRQQAFVNRVSHEFKTPLAGVKVMADLIALGIVTDDTEVQQSAQRIITEVSRMEDRVNDVLRLARSPTITSREPLDLRAMVEKLVEIWTPRFEQHGARLTATLERTAPVLGDRHIIHDAIGNLLDNALKYLSEDHPGLVMVRTATSGKWVIVDVSDNGIGVPEAMRRAIFQRFTRVEGDGRGKAGGHGLGLAFVAEAVHGHAGKIECREGIAGGARFVIRLRRS